jgi:hypothetical protein
MGRRVWRRVWRWGPGDRLDGAEGLAVEGLDSGGPRRSSASTLATGSTVGAGLAVDGLAEWLDAGDGLDAVGPGGRGAGDRLVGGGPGDRLDAGAGLDGGGPGGGGLGGDPRRGGGPRRSTGSTLDRLDGGAGLAEILDAGAHDGLDARPARRLGLATGSTLGLASTVEGLAVEGLAAMSLMSFGRAMEDRGIGSKRSNGIWYLGIAIKESL